MGAAIVQAVYDQVLDRKANPKEGSYTNKLLEKGEDKIGKKVVEEAAEVLIAAKNRSVEEVRFEVADPDVSPDGSAGRPRHELGRHLRRTGKPPPLSASRKKPAAFPFFPREERSGFTI